MIGNDIVDLAQAKQDSNWRRPGFLAKVFTTHEQHLIHSTSNPDLMVWLLWSLKECAYKAAVRQSGQRLFAPQKVVCQLTHVGEGVAGGMVFYGQQFQTESIITHNYIASIAYLPGVSSGIRSVIVPFDNAMYAHQYQAIRRAIKQDFAARLSIPEHAIDIQKDAIGAPFLLVDGDSAKPVSLPISLSHHGYYGAYFTPFFTSNTVR